MIEITCTGCKKKLKAPLEAAGKKGRCSECGSIFEVPSAAGGDNIAESSPAGPGEAFGAENTEKILEALRNLDEVRRSKSIKGDIDQPLALKFQALMQGAMYPKDISREIGNMLKKESGKSLAKSSKAVSAKLKAVNSCLIELKKRGKKEEEIRQEWARLARGAWREKESVSE